MTDKTKSLKLPALTSATLATKPVTVRLSTDLIQHLQDVAASGAGDMSKALNAVVRLHRDGRHGLLDNQDLIRKLDQLAARIDPIEREMSEIKEVLLAISQDQKSHSQTLFNLLSGLFSLLRDGSIASEPEPELGLPDPKTAYGTSQLPVSQVSR